jgi:hypothetical protein
MMILGMDPFVFTAWLGCILATVLCVVYGIYHEYIKEKKKKKKEEE